MPDFQLRKGWRNNLLGLVISTGFALVIVGGVAQVTGAAPRSPYAMPWVLLSYVYGAWFLVYFLVSERDNGDETEPTWTGLFFDFWQSLAAIAALLELGVLLGGSIIGVESTPSRAIMRVNVAIGAICGLSFVLFSGGGRPSIDVVRALGLVVGLVMSVSAIAGTAERAILIAACAGAAVHWVLLFVFIARRRDAIGWGARDG